MPWEPSSTETRVTTPWVLDLRRRALSHAGQPVLLAGRGFDLLAVLAREPGKVFPAAHLLKAVWPGRVVEEANLRVQVTLLRKTLGADAIKNVAGQGYVLTLPVRRQEPSPEPQRGRVDTIPRSALALLGRQAELADLKTRVMRHALLTVAGAGGIGKTRLAQQVALEVSDAFPGGAAWVDLAALSSGRETRQDVCDAIAVATGWQASTFRGDGAVHRLARALEQSQVLLVLDNAEHLAADLVPLLREVLHAAPGVKVLVTSQTVLRLPEEQVVWLEPLALPGEQASPEEVASSPAVQLLVQRAQARDQRFVLEKPDLPYAARIVRDLDGLALAIEMAAARAPVMGLAALEQRLGDRLRVLGGNAQAALPRHRTLRATLDWSHDLLTPEERSAVRQLSIFAAPFRVDVAERLIAGVSGDQVRALSLVHSLVDKSLLQWQPPARVGLPPRLRMLETTRLYAREALARHPEEARSVERSYLRALAMLAGPALDDFQVASDRDWIDRWVPDHPDWTQAFDLAHAQNESELAAPIIEILVLGANITNDVRPALPRLAASRALAERASPLARAILLGWGSRLFVRGQSRVDMSSRRVQNWRELQDPQRLCVALAMHVCVLRETGDRAGAEAALAECLALEHPHWSPRVRWRCGWIASRSLAFHDATPGALQRMAQLSRELLASLRRMGAFFEASMIEASMAFAMALEGRHREALHLLDTAIAAQLQLGAALDAGVNLGRKAVVLTDLAEREGPGSATWPLAAAAFREALARVGHDPMAIRRFVFSLALTVWRLGGRVESATLLLSGERLHEGEAHHEKDHLQARACAIVRQCLDSELSPELHTLARSRAAHLDAQGLRVLALEWIEGQDHAAHR